MDNLAQLILTSDANFLQLVNPAPSAADSDDIALTETSAIEGFQALDGQAQDEHIMLSTENRDYTANMINNAVRVGETQDGSTIWKITIAPDVNDYLRLVSLSYH